MKSEEFVIKYSLISSLKGKVAHISVSRTEPWKFHPHSTHSQQLNRLPTKDSHSKIYHRSGTSRKKQRKDRRDDQHLNINYGVSKNRYHEGCSASCPFSFCKKRSTIQFLFLGLPFWTVNGKYELFWISKDARTQPDTTFCR